MEVDVVITAMMDWDPKKIKILEMAHQQGLGEIDLCRIEVVGDLEILPEFEKPPTFAFDPKFNPYEAITNILPVLDKERCILCWQCGDESCPAGAIIFDSYPVIEKGKCISCYCCVEFCPEGALRVQYRKDLLEVA